MRDGTKTIAEVVETYGISQTTLEFYEDQGLLAPVRDNVMRHYSPSDCTKLEVILRGKKLGFSLGELRKLIGGVPVAHATTVETTLRADAQALQAQIDCLNDRRDEIQDTIDALKSALRASRA